MRVILPGLGKPTIAPISAIRRIVERRKAKTEMTKPVTLLVEAMGLTQAGSTAMLYLDGKDAPVEVDRIVRVNPWLEGPITTETLISAQIYNDRVEKRAPDKIEFYVSSLIGVDKGSHTFASASQ